MLWTVPKLWDGGECWIIGGGTSMPRQFHIPLDIINQVSTGKLPYTAYLPYLEPLKDKHVIGINNAYRLGSIIDVCFFGDCSWYLVHRIALASFDGLKVTCCNRFRQRSEKEMEGIKYLAKDKQVNHGISTNPQCVAWNNNSGAAAISLAHHLGVKRIYLLGFDMKLDNDKRFSHWHGSHNHAKKNFVPPFARHLKGFPSIAKHAQNLGLEIINTNPDSAIKEFKVVQVDEILGNTKAVEE